MATQIPNPTQTSKIKTKIKPPIKQIVKEVMKRFEETKWTLENPDYIIIAEYEYPIGQNGYMRCYCVTEGKVEKCVGFSVHDLLEALPLMDYLGEIEVSGYRVKVYYQSGRFGGFDSVVLVVTNKFLVLIIEVQKGW